MADRVSPAALRGSLATLRGYMDDLARSSFDDHATKLRLFVNYFQKDDTVRYLADRLHVRLRDVLKVAMAPKLELPADPLDRVAFIYEVLFHLKQGVRLDVREFLSRALQGATLEEKWEDFRRSWLDALSEGIADLVERVEILLDSEDVDPEIVFTIALHSGVEGLDEELEAPAPARAPLPLPEVAEQESGSSVGPAKAALRAAIAATRSDRRAELETELEILELEAKKTKPDLERLGEILASFADALPELGVLANAMLVVFGEPPAEDEPDEVPAPVKKKKPAAAAKKKKPAAAAKKKKPAAAAKKKKPAAAAKKKKPAAAAKKKKPAAAAKKKKPGKTKRR